jgi:uncharacterized protein YndB with AHSA1/START domain
MSAPQHTPDEPPEGRSIDVSIDVPGTPEEVWQAIATGPGISSWFVRHTVEPRPGGAVTEDFGSFGVVHCTVSDIEPPRRIVFVSDDGPLAWEWTIEARDGGTCRVRLVNSGFGSGADWDGEYDGATQGWALFLANLRLHRQHFPGQHATPLIPSVAVPGPHAAAWAAVCERMGVPPDLPEGAPFEPSGDGLPPAQGTVAAVLHGRTLTAYMLVLDDPVPATGFLAAEGSAAESDPVMVSFWRYQYGDGSPSATDDWGALLAQWYPSP